MRLENGRRVASSDAQYFEQLITVRPAPADKADLHAYTAQQVQVFEGCIKYKQCSYRAYKSFNYIPMIPDKYDGLV